MRTFKTNPTACTIHILKMDSKFNNRSIYPSDSIIPIEDIETTLHYDTAKPWESARECVEELFESQVLDKMALRNYAIQIGEDSTIYVSTKNEDGDWNLSSSNWAISPMVENDTLKHVSGNTHQFLLDFFMQNAQKAGIDGFLDHIKQAFHEGKHSDALMHTKELEKALKMHLYLKMHQK